MNIALMKGFAHKLKHYSMHNWNITKTL